MAFYQLLVAARKQWFIDALSDALGRLDQAAIKAEAAKYIPADAQKILASAGLRDEYVFPLPVVLREKPSLVGYYRLLLGASQESFYKGSTGMGRFRAMEEHAALSPKAGNLLPDFCRAMCESLAELVRQIPNITDRDIRELPLLTFGSQLQGASNTEIGKKAMHDVFIAITEIVRGYITKQEPERLTLKNASGRTVVITLGRDPDVSVCEVVNEKTHNKVAIEVKGGTDVSNAHNRAGEAEKSHTKARSKGFRDFWTIISKKGLDMGKLKAESQTTTLWFDVAEVLARTGEDWNEFRSRLISEIGIPASRTRRRG
ncbi:MAG: XcyI family restriction endonuclease [Terriglobia bacterium]